MMVLLAVSPCIMPKPVTQHHQHRKPQNMREAEADEADAKDRGGDGNHLGEPAHRAPHHHGQRRNQRAHADRAHQKAQRVRAAVQNLRRRRSA